jgi:NADH:ubiquinone oxidoreductase subunit 5 (subunit L)/multisubunit Na+/H+ antiporter MnhA subunit
MDGYAWLFALLVAFIGTLVVMYARYYMSPQDPVPRFFSFLMAFMDAMLGTIVGGYELDAVLAAGDTIRAHPWYGATLVLLVVGVLTKSAQFPFHFWLPHAMSAPTPVSAYLHS